jgi:hypothetical protein
MAEKAASEAVLERLLLLFFSEDIEGGRTEKSRKTTLEAFGKENCDEHHALGSFSRARGNR